MLCPAKCPATYRCEPVHALLDELTQLSREDAIRRLGEMDLAEVDMVLTPDCSGDCRHLREHYAEAKK